MQPIRVDYSDKRVLLVETSGNMRSTIVYMLRQLGVSNIHAVTINDQLMALIKEESFDIVLLGHNSSDTVTGMQILEECRFRGYMKPTACWVFMTSDSSQEVILHAIDSQPDALITKPFTMEELKARLDVLIYRKSSLKEVDDAISRGQLDRAVKLCDRVELAGSNYDYVQLIKGRLLLQMNRFDEAERFFKFRFVHLSEKESGLCLADAYIGLERFDEAKQHLSALVEKYPLLLSAYDRLAQVLELEGELLPAQETLKSATQKSPLSIQRHMELGRVAVYNKVLDVAESAYRRSVSLGKHSCYRSPEPYLRLANIRRLELASASDKEKITLQNQFDELINTAGYQFPKDALFKVNAALLRSQVAQDLGDVDDANRHMQEAGKLAAALEAPVDLSRMMLDITGDKVPVLDQPAAEPAKAAAHKHDPAMSEKVNRLGVKHYLADKVPQAIRYFGLAIEYDAKNAKALLNLAQLFLESAYQHSARRDERLKMVTRYMRLTERMVLEAEESEKLRRLQGALKAGIEGFPAEGFGPLLR